MQNQNKEIIEEINIEGLLDTNIYHSTIPTPIDTIISRLISGFYFIPNYQRQYVWNEKQVVALMVSLLKNIPIPKLYMYNKPNDGRYTIIDGQQRLTSLFFFIKGIFPASKERKTRYDFKAINELVEEYYTTEKITLKRKKEIEKILLEKYELKFKIFKYKDQLNKKEYTLSFNNFTLEKKLEFLNKTFEFGSVSIKSDNIEELENIYIDIFRILNSAGSPLTNQEIRNGIYSETTLYKEIIKFDQNNKNWQKISKKLFRDNSITRSNNIEFLLRLLALDVYIEREKENLIFEGYQSYSKLIDKISLENSKINVSFYITKLEKFFNKMSLEKNIKEKIQILNIESYFLAFSKLNLLESNSEIPIELITEKLDINLKSSSKNAILKRINLSIDKLLNYN